MLILALDTAADVCAACVWDAQAGCERGRAVASMRTGHAENLIGAIEAALSESHADYRSLSRIAVSVGPGSFTGIRVGVAASRGLALALKIPAVGISTLEALAAESRDALGAQAVLALLGTGGEGMQAAAYDARGVEIHPPAVVDAQTAAAWAAEGPCVLAGSAALRLAAMLPGRPAMLGPLGGTADIAVYARLAGKRAPGGKPKPLYLRAPDAKPQGTPSLAPRHPEGRGT